MQQNQGMVMAETRGTLKIFNLMQRAIKAMHELRQRC